MIITIDEGTTSTRVLLISSDGKILDYSQKEITQIYPEAAWVEHDPIEIWQKTLECLRELLSRNIHSGRISASDLEGIAITNQRETTIIWDKVTGKPVYNAIVWQDKRTSIFCNELKEDLEFATLVRKQTGLIIDAYFSASKIRWVWNNVILPKNLNVDNLLFGTIDTWLLWNLTQGQSHYTEASNASRTMLWDIHKSEWITTVLEKLNIPEHILPKVLPANSCFGESTLLKDLGIPSLPILAILGDQQAAFYAYNGEAKATYGTGIFLLMPSSGALEVNLNEGLVTSVGYACGNEVPRLIKEGSIFVGGSIVQWLRDELKFIVKSSEIQALAESVKDSAGVYLVPALAGLGAPFWRGDIRGAMFGLTRSTNQAHIARAALESMAFRVRDVFEALDTQSKSLITHLNVDGGASRNKLLMQFQADLLQIPVKRYTESEMTALGVSRMTGKVDLELKAETVLEPKVNLEARYQEWKHYLKLLLA